MAHLLLTGAPVLLLPALLACGGSKDDPGTHAGMADSAAAKPVELKVSNVMIGKRIGAGKHITEPTFQFAPAETVYVSVGTSGSTGADHLTAAWRSQTGEVLQQSSEPIPAAGQNAAFQLSQPKGLKVGTYKVVVFLGNDSADTKVFVVKK
ncbi:MAG TPA: hypothetical protein VJQ46_16640 [Gemmatimonadales bacterium]|nr:hypothetical protein [Gemmatimonadales bacterium]